MVDNPTRVIGDIGQNVSFDCAAGLDTGLTWIQTYNKTGLFYFEEDSRTQLINNNGTLQITHVKY